MKKLLLVLLCVALVGCAKTTGIPAHFTNDKENFKESILALNKARELSQPPKGKETSAFDIPDNVEKEIFSLTEKGVALSKNVSDEFLDYLYPNLKTMYRGKLIEGSTLWYMGAHDSYSQEGIANQLKSAKLINEWVNWWYGKPLKEVGDKIF